VQHKPEVRDLGPTANARHINVSAWLLGQADGLVSGLAVCVCVCVLMCVGECRRRRPTSMSWTTWMFVRCVALPWVDMSLRGGHSSFIRWQCGGQTCRTNRLRASCAATKCFWTGRLGRASLARCFVVGWCSRRTKRTTSSRTTAPSPWPSKRSSQRRRRMSFPSSKRLVCWFSLCFVFVRLWRVAGDHAFG
jgi:hypothetical protein